jgi:hypothetical protein
MKRPSRAADEARRIDALYGLEPVFEPQGSDGAGDAIGGTPGGTEFHQVQCPYCGESFDTLLDLSAGSAAYIEDCQVCCQPIEFRIEVDHDGALAAFSAVRGD